MGICYMYKGPILWGHNAEHDACTEDQSYGDTMQNMMHVQRTNPMGQFMQLHVPMHGLK